MQLVVFIQVALLFVQLVQLVSSVDVEDESTLKRCINTDCLGNNTVLEGIKQELCDIQDTECTDNPCKNGGTCVNVTDSPVCQCPPEFVGKFCELNCTVEYEMVGVLVDFEAVVINQDNVLSNSEEECDSTCTGNCTASFFRDSLCVRFRAPVFSVTPLSVSIESIEEAEAACKSTCISQMNSCRSFILERFITVVCLTFTVSATDLPVSPTEDSSDVFNKIKKCDISP